MLYDNHIKILMYYQGVLYSTASLCFVGCLLSGLTLLEVPFPHSPQNDLYILFRRSSLSHVCC